MDASNYIRWFKDLGAGDVDQVRGKTASLGELYSALSDSDVAVPEGFAITASAYRDALTAQDESYLNIRGEDALVRACRRCFASLFTERAISYRAGTNGWPIFVA
jgi:phosphoenolpyruvate synthase/pyruvate phosphate dikinase